MSRDADTAGAFDAQMMAIAVGLIRRGLGTTAFNPSVGAVIADESTGAIIARGWTQPGGRPHGEKEALRRAGEQARGKTMYVTLEPCAHTGRVPTCADAVIAAGLKRVVCALADPNPVIAGRGFDQLRAAGVTVDVGLQADAARVLTAGHILHVTQSRPFVQLKLAVSQAGRIAAGTGQPVWVTGPDARARGHLLRAEADAILTGIGTILADDPALTCRLPGLTARSPQRVIVASRPNLPAAARVLRHAADPTARVWLATTTATAQSPATQALQAAGRLTDVIAAGTHHVDLATLLTALDQHAIRRVLVEAGPRLSQGFLTADLVDEVVLFRGTTDLGAAGLVPLAAKLAPLAASDLAQFDGPRWHLVDARTIGTDQMHTFRRTRAD
jgi:diaminohydroxyphosphoribosylaminopyrimidine deaminase / 5-amino-6-(5-phosphoribosylamino)uracil reductase